MSGTSPATTTATGSRRCRILRLFGNGSWLVDFVRFLAAVLEVGLIPAGAFQLEASGGNQFDEGILAALWASYQGWITHFLDGFQLVTTFFTTVFVNRHTTPPVNSLVTAKCVCAIGIFQDTKSIP